MLKLKHSPFRCVFFHRVKGTIFPRTEIEPHSTLDSALASAKKPRLGVTQAMVERAITLGQGFRPNWLLVAKKLPGKPMVFINSNERETP